MTAAYLARLGCLSLACFFLLHTILALIVWAFAGRAIRMAERMRPREGARLLLALRLLPVALSLVAVAGLCVPSFLWLEPSETAEEAGWACVVAAFAGAALWTAALLRAARALRQSRRYMKLCRQAARSDPRAMWIVDAPAPVLALAGLRRPRVIVSRNLLDALDAEHMEAALLHEQAHLASHDNLKRLALVAAPEILPGRNAFRTLEQAWSRITEWSADERAAAGDPHRRLALAEALVRAARMGCCVTSAGPLATTLLDDPQDLGARISRLLDPPAAPRNITPYWAAAGLAAATLALFVCQPATLYSVHALLEEWMR